MKFIYASLVLVTAAVFSGCANDGNGGLTAMAGGGLQKHFVYWGPGSGQPAPADQINAAREGLDDVNPPGSIVP